MTLPTDGEEVNYLHERGRYYSEVVPSIKICFYVEAYYIEEEWKAARSSVELLAVRRKQDALLYRYHVLEAFEKSLPVNKFSLIIFAVTSIVCIAMDILLTLPSNDGITELVGSLMVLFYYTSNLTYLVFWIIELVIGVDKKFLLSIYRKI